MPGAVEHQQYFHVQKPGYRSKQVAFSEKPQPYSWSTGGTDSLPKPTVRVAEAPAMIWARGSMIDGEVPVPTIFPTSAFLAVTGFC